MNLTPVWHDNICIVTMPLFFKNFKPRLIKWLLKFKIVRGFILFLGWIWTKEIVRRMGFQSPDLIAVSNIYAAPFVKRLCKGLPVLYDMNDDHLAFPNTPKWAGDYYRSLCVSANKIVMTTAQMIKLLPAKGKFNNHVVSNGVDNSLLRDKKIMLYIGTIAEFIDVKLLEKLAEEFPQAILRLIGPVTANVESLKTYSNVEFIEPLPQNIMADQIKAATVCLIPYIASARTAMTELTGKVLLYLAAGKPIISIGRPKTNEEFLNPNLIYSAGSHEEFIFYLKALLYKNDRNHAKERQRLALANDWNKKAEEMTEIIRGLANEDH
jgi:glycosyltransferase involved in cell wall biosynthesis